MPKYFEHVARQTRGEVESTEFKLSPSKTLVFVRHVLNALSGSVLFCIYHWSKAVGASLKCCVFSHSCSLPAELFHLAFTCSTVEFWIHLRRWGKKHERWELLTCLTESNHLLIWTICCNFRARGWNRQLRRRRRRRPLRWKLLSSTLLWYCVWKWNPKFYNVTTQDKGTDWVVFCLNI